MDENIEVEIEETEDIYEDLTKDDTPHTDGNGDEIHPTHAVVLKSGDIFFCYETIELERIIGDGISELMTICNVLDFPDEGDRSIISVRNDNIDYIHEFFDQENWDDLVKRAMESHLASRIENDGDRDLYA